MSDIAIKVRGLGKKYHIGEKLPQRSLAGSIKNAAGFPWKVAKSLIAGKALDQREEFWALKDVAFDVKQGEVLGIIGRNGAGKSTLLKILSRITTPTEGEVELFGRVGCLLEVGTGFHPELTGRENIFLNGSLLGMSNVEIKKRFDEIVDFSGVERFLDTPVKFYSSGMYTRLAFSVAAHLNPEILIVDEVLAVGDAEFQKKCLGKMDSIAKSGRTILFVSHNMQAVSSLCRSGIYLENGKIRASDSINYCLDTYLKDASIMSEINHQKRTYKIIAGKKICFGIVDSEQKGYWITGRDVYLDIEYINNSNVVQNNVEIAFGIYSELQHPVIYLGTKVSGQNVISICHNGHSRCFIPCLPVEPGLYTVNYDIKVNGTIVDHAVNAARIEVKNGDFYGTGQIWPFGKFLAKYSWSHDEN